MTSGYSFARPTAILIWARFFRRLLPSQMPWMTLRPTFAARAGNRSRPFSIEYVLTHFEILASWARSSAICSGGILVVAISGVCSSPERSIGHAFQFRCRIDWRAREPDRRDQPPPHCRDQAQRYDEKRQRRTKGNRVYPPRKSSISRSRRICQGRQPDGHNFRATALPQSDKPTGLLDKIQNLRHGNLGRLAALGTNLKGI